MNASPRHALFVALLCSACNGVGRPVVDRWGEPADQQGACTRRPPQCADRDRAPVELEVAASGREASPACAWPAQQAPERQSSPALHGCTLTVEAMDGHVQLSGATLDEVNVMLEAGAQLTIANSQLYRVSFESAGEPGTATVQISHSELRSSLLRVQKVELVSTFLDVSVVEADELSAVDLEAREAILSSRLATISASRLRTTRVNECETLLIAHSEVNNSHVEACARATRLYEVEAIGATFDGELESDLSSFIEGRFGVRDATTLLSWNSTLNNVALCAGTNQVRFSSGALYCVTCAGPLDARAADLCLGSGSTSMDSNTCRALDQPPICSPFPARQRPFSGT